MKLNPKIGRYFAFLTKWFSCGFVGVIVYEAIALKCLVFGSEAFSHLAGAAMGWIVLDELLNGSMWKGTKLREEE